MGSTSTARTFTVQTVAGPVEIPADLRDPQVREAYVEGQCVALALELHKRTSFPIVVVLDEPHMPMVTSSKMADAIAGSLHHAFVLAPGGIAIDIDGPRPLRDFLESVDPGYSAENYHGRDPDLLVVAEMHDLDCLCQEQCYLNASYSVVEVSSSDLEYVIELGYLPRPARRAAAYFAGQILRDLDLPSKVKVAPRAASRSRGPALGSRRA